MMCHNNFPDAIEWLNSPETSLITDDDAFYQSNRSNINVSTRRFLFWSRKVFEGVHSHVMDLLRKTDLVHSVSSKFMITCSNPILVHFSIVRISDFAPISIRSKNLDQNREFELLKVDQNRIWTRDQKFRREN